jgi:hypothetical protein
LPVKEKKAKKPVSDYLPEMMLNTELEKYKLIPAVARWVFELEKREENKGILHPQLMEMALRDLLSGKVTIDEVDKLPPLPAPKKTPGAKGDRHSREQ